MKLLVKRCEWTVVHILSKLLTMMHIQSCAFVLFLLEVYLPSYVSNIYYKTVVLKRVVSNTALHVSFSWVGVGVGG